MAYSESQFINSSNSYSGNIEVDAICEAGTGGVVYFLLYGGAGASGANGYLGAYDSRSGNQAARIYRLDNGTATDIGSYTGSANASQLSGPQSLRLTYHLANHSFAIYFNGTLWGTATDSTYTISGPAGYGAGVATPAYISRLAVKGHNDIHPSNVDSTGKAIAVTTTGSSGSKPIKGVGDTQTLSLDTEIADGATHARTLASDLSNGHVIKTGTSGQYTIKGVGDANTLSLDTDIADGATHARTLASDLSSGHVVKTGSSGQYTIKGVGDANTLNLDTEIADGTTHARPLAADMNAGHIVKTGSSGQFTIKGVGDTNTLNLDSEIADGTTHARTLASDLSGGHVIKTGASGQYTIKGVGDANTLSLDTDVADGSSYARPKKTTLTSGVPNQTFMHQFSSAVIDSTGTKIDVNNLVG